MGNCRSFPLPAPPPPLLLRSSCVGFRSSRSPLCHPGGASHPTPSACLESPNLFSRPIGPLLFFSSFLSILPQRRFPTGSPFQSIHRSFIFSSPYSQIIFIGLLQPWHQLNFTRSSPPPSSFFYLAPVPTSDHIFGPVTNLSTPDFGFFSLFARLQSNPPMFLSRIFFPRC